MQSNIVFSCDVCGGINTNPSIGLFASTKFHTIGIKSQYRWYTSQENNHWHSSEHFISHEAFFRYQLFKKIQLSGNLPFVQNIQLKKFGKETINGIGDISLFSNFIYLSKQNKFMKINHFASFGFGIKAPTGESAENINYTSNLYPGSGAWDYLLSTSYTYQSESNFGIQNEINYCIKGKSKIEYKKGNVLGLKSNFFLKKKFKSFQLIPSIGISFDNFESEYKNENRVSDSPNKGSILSSEIGIHIFSNKCIFSAKISRGIYQKLYNNNITQNLQSSISFQYLFKSK